MIQGEAKSERLNFTFNVRMAPMKLKRYAMLFFKPQGFRARQCCS